MLWRDAQECVSHGVRGPRLPPNSHNGGDGGVDGRDGDGGGGGGGSGGGGDPGGCGGVRAATGAGHDGRRREQDSCAEQSAPDCAADEEPEKSAACEGRGQLKGEGVPRRASSTTRAERWTGEAPQRLSPPV